LSADPKRPEAWAWLAYACAALQAALLVYLGTRPGGEWPVIAYRDLRPVLELLALATLFGATVWCLVRRPVLQRRRLAPCACLLLVVGVGSYPFPYPSSREGVPSSVRFRLPFAAAGDAGAAGEWTVVWGGERREHNILAAFSPDRRWGLELVVTEAGRSRRGQARAPEDHLVYGREVLAPADGRVAGVTTGLADEPLGDHVVIRVAEGEYAFLCHLQEGSIAVAAGQQVRAGEPIGRVGATGRSSTTPEPHLALHLQTTPFAGRGEAVPWRFHDFLADGIPVASGLPTGGVGPGGTFTGQRVRSRAREGR